MLRQHRYYALPILGQGKDADKLLGIITRAEIAKAFRVSRYSKLRYQW